MDSNINFKYFDLENVWIYYLEIGLKNLVSVLFLYGVSFIVYIW